MKHARDFGGDPSVLPDAPDPFEALVAAALRAWERGGAGAALPMLRARMTEAQAAVAMAALCDLAGLLCISRRRSPAARVPADSRLGADEALFARFVREAALGEREDALLLASLLVEAPALMAVTDAAARFGLHVHRGVLNEARGLTNARPPVRTLH
jgi:hypothetical protein